MASPFLFLFAEADTGQATRCRSIPLSSVWGSIPKSARLWAVLTKGRIAG